MVPRSQNTHLWELEFCSRSESSYFFVAVLKWNWNTGINCARILSWNFGFFLRVIRLSYLVKSNFYLSLIFAVFRSWNSVLQEHDGLNSSVQCSVNLTTKTNFDTQGKNEIQIPNNICMFGNSLSDIWILIKLHFLIVILQLF